MSGENLTKQIWHEIASENSGELEPAELKAVLDSLALFTAPATSREETAALIAKLSPHFKPIRCRRFRDRISGSEENPVLSLLQLVRPQISILEKSFWLATFILMAIGVLASPFSPDRVQSLVLIAPLLAALGTCYAFRSIGDGTYDLERTCPVNPTNLALARLLLVVSYDIFLGLAASLILWQWQPGPALVKLVFSWLAPLLFFTGLALVLTVRIGAVPGSILTLSLWIAQVILLNTRGEYDFFALPGTVYWLEIKTGLAISGIFFVIYGLLVYRKGKITGGLGYGA